MGACFNRKVSFVYFEIVTMMSFADDERFADDEVRAPPWSCARVTVSEKLRCTAY